MTPEVAAVFARAQQHPWTTDHMPFAEAYEVGHAMQYAQAICLAVNEHAALVAERDALVTAKSLTQRALIEHMDRNERLVAVVEAYKEALIWCSGSPDFNEGGQAREGWLKLCAPLLAALETP